MVTTNEEQPAAELLRTFGKQEGCEAYRTDSAKISLLLRYLRVQQIVPACTFAAFLQGFRPLADHNEQNLKDPTDALRARCPRTKAAAAEQGAPQWSAKDCVGILALYADVLTQMAPHVADASLPTLDAFLRAGGTRFLAGELGALHSVTQQELPFAAAPAPPAAVPAEVPYEDAAGDPLPVDDFSTTPCPAILTQPGGRQFRGRRLREYRDGETRRVYADFVADDGELFEGVVHDAVVVCATTAPEQAGVVPVAVEPPARPECTCGCLTLSRAEAGAINEVLTTMPPIAAGADAETLLEYSVDVADGFQAAWRIINGEQGPYVDARLFEYAKGRREGANVVSLVSTVRPRSALIGEYHFSVPGGAGEDPAVFRVDVVEDFSGA